MFEYLGSVGAELHGEMVKMYWVPNVEIPISIVPVVCH